MLRTSLLTALAATLALTPACFDAYDPPPEVKLTQPAAGFWTADTPLVVTFSERIDPATLSVSIYASSVLDKEQAIPADATPLVGGCTLAASPCGSLTMTLDELGTTLTIAVGETFDGLEGFPYMLLIDEGLADMAGRPNAVERRFDFQISPSSACGGVPVDLDLETGVFTFTANLQVLPIWLHMYMDIAIDPDNGQFLITAMFARVEDGLSANYDHPDGFIPAIDDQGWALSLVGCIEARPNDEFFFVTDPVDLSIVALGAIPVILDDLKVQGTLKPGAGENGRTLASGTMSTSGGSFTTGEDTTPVEALTTAWTGFGVTAEELPADVPRTCADDPCAALRAAGGDCQLTTPWSPNDEVPDGTVCE